MIATISVILGIIVLISLYDYLSSRSWQSDTSGERVETVFENRNRSYGAYKIRRNYNLLLILITLGMGGAVAASYGVSKALIKPVAKKKKKKRTVDMSTFADDEKKEEEKELEPLDQEVPEEQKTLAFLPPVIVDKTSNQEPTIQEEAKGKDVGAETKDGTEWTPPPPPPPPVEEKKDPPPILEVVEEPAEYPGGREALVAFLQKNIKVPSVAEELGIKGKVYLRFVVSEKGNISNVSVKKGIADCKECDEEAVRVVKKMPDWTPAKNGGKNVNAWYTLPIVFNVQ